MTEKQTVIGRVTRCSIQGFVGGIRLRQPDLPTFGGWCQAPAQGGETSVIGLIYDISIEDDELARQLAAADAPLPEQQADNQYNRPIPIEIQALAVGYRRHGAYIQALPPQPPITLAEITSLDAAEVRTFTQRLDFLPMALATPEVPADQVVAAALRQAAQARPKDERRAFLLQAGQECARLLGQDLGRLERLLRDLQAGGEA
ncbi:MAG: hypothetical protein MUO23_06915 [Anaerolineales bacterium]|nr:hypothetical protein [Anaerolineales bacterium]